MVREGSWSIEEAPRPERQEEAPVQHAPLELPFTWSQGALELSIAATAVLLGAILLAVSGGMDWGEVQTDEATVIVTLDGAAIGSGGFGTTIGWESQQFDDADGIGQVRIATTLHLIGLITGFLAAATLVASIFARAYTLTTLGAILGVVGAGLGLTATIMFPSGAERVWDWFRGQGIGDAPSDIDWGAGPVLSWVSLVLLFAGLVAAFVATRHHDVS